MEEKPTEGTQVENKTVETSAEVVSAEPTPSETVAPKTPCKPVGFFSFRGRMDRISFFANGIVASLFSSVAQIIAYFIGDNPLGYLIILVGYLLTYYRYIVITVRRFHDFGKSGYYVMAVYAYDLSIFSLPFIFGFEFHWIYFVATFIAAVMHIVILFYPGDSQENQYGPVPTKFISWN